MIQNFTNKNYINKVTNDITEVMNENLLKVVLEKNPKNRSALDGFMDKTSDDNEHFALYSGLIEVGSIIIKDKTITHCSIFSTFSEGVFALYNENVNNSLKSFIGRKINI